MSRTSRIIVDRNATDGYEFRGGNLAMLGCKDKRAIVAGPADTGKTVVCCLKLHYTCLMNPGSQHAMLRKTYASIAGSCAQTYGRIIKGWGVKVLGGDPAPRLYTYPNGSKVWVGGLDNPERALSSERDTIYVNQAEQLTQDDWETISTRSTGRSAIVKHPQLFGDCNPAGSKHWIRQLARDKSLTLFTATHKDNPSIYDRSGNMYPDAHTRIQALSELTGVRRKRLFEGVWATAEGAVYENFDAAVHMISRAHTEIKRWFLCEDDGWTHPAVILLVGEDGDGRWHVAREFYQTGKLQAEVVRVACEWFQEKRCELNAVDNARPDLIAALCNLGVRAIGGKGGQDSGINAIRDRLKVQGDGKPRLTFDPTCVNCQNEFESYVYEPGTDKPRKEHDHTSDALRYLHDVLAVPSGAFHSISEIHTAARPGFRDLSLAGDIGHLRKEDF